MNKFQAFLSGYKTNVYKKGEVILRQDIEPTCAYVIKKGIIKTYNLTASGEERAIGFTIAHELFPLGWVFDKISKTQYYYEALSATEVYAVPKEELLAYIHGSSKAMFHLLDRCVWESILQTMHINALEQSKASDKLLHTIHYLALFFGHDLRTDVVEIPLPLTQQDIANFTGLTRETISAELKKLVDQKIIFYRRRKYIVLTDKLNELLDDEYERRLIR